MGPQQAPRGLVLRGPGLGFVVGVAVRGLPGAGMSLSRRTWGRGVEGFGTGHHVSIHPLAQPHGS